ncbi:MAG: hypothetical protein KAS96_06965, partial [Planctomycetes bacterium]|nr:hypothetical protein [Planctomycetota bacterium]
MIDEQPIGSHVILDHDPEINKFFRAAIKVDASDLHLKVGMVPKLRINGSLKNTTGTKLTEKFAEKLMFEIITEGQKKFFLEKGALDFAHQVGPADR